MVRLKQEQKFWKPSKLQGLNSTMVRLKHKKTVQEVVNETTSQFHYGSIKTVMGKPNKKTVQESQFHYGSIKT